MERDLPPTLTQTGPVGRSAGPAKPVLLTLTTLYLSVCLSLYTCLCQSLSLPTSLCVSVTRTQMHTAPRYAAEAHKRQNFNGHTNHCGFLMSEEQGSK